MFSRITVWLAKFALERAVLSIENRNLLTTLILKRLEALPLSDIIKVNEEGRLLVNGRSLDPEGARLYSTSAKIALDSRAEKLIDAHVQRIAFLSGVHKAVTVEEMNFYKAAIWWGEKRREFLSLLTGLSNDGRELTP